MADRSFYRHELAFAHEQAGAAIKELLVLKARWPSPFAPGDSVVHAGVAHTILGVYFTSGRVQYRLSDGSNVDSKDVTVAVVPQPPGATT